MNGPLRDGFEWACPAGSDVWGIRREGAWRLLCGEAFQRSRRAPGFRPVVQPITPQPQCKACVAKYQELA